MSFTCIVDDLRISFQSHISSTGTQLHTEPERVPRVPKTVCPGEYVVLNCSVQHTSVLIWRVSSQLEIKCYGNINTTAGSSCNGNTNTSYAIIKKFSYHNAVLNNITSSLTITDIDGNMEVDCSNQLQKQETYALHQSTYVARYFIVMMTTEAFSQSIGSLFLNISIKAFTHLVVAQNKSQCTDVFSFTMNYYIHAVVFACI